jgi:hypothetical protein
MINNLAQSQDLEWKTKTRGKLYVCSGNSQETKPRKPEKKASESREKKKKKKKKKRLNCKKETGAKTERQILFLFITNSFPSSIAASL